MTAAFTLTPQSWPRVDPSRLWRARYALAVATQRHVYGYPPTDAARRGYFDVLVEWTEQDATANTLPSSEAEPLARAALAALGIVEPRKGGRGRPVSTAIQRVDRAWPLVEAQSIADRERPRG